MSMIRWFVLLCVCGYGAGVQRQSMWSVRLSQADSDSLTIFPNYMYKDSYVTTLFYCESKEDVQISIKWYLQQLHCMDEMYNAQAKKYNGYDSDYTPSVGAAQKQLFNELYLAAENTNATCPENWQLVASTVFQESTKAYQCSEDKIITLAEESFFPRRKSHVYTSRNLEDAEKKVCVDTITPSLNSTLLPEVNRRVVSTWEDGMYQFLLQVTPLKKSQNFTISVQVEMRSHSGFLSAIQWPLLPLSGIMSFLYLCVGTTWVFVWARAHQHSQKIHIVIGVVAVSGAMANTFTFVDLSTINGNGIGYSGIQWLSRFIDTFQGTVTALVLMIVSTGYGITRPSLSRTIMNGALLIAAFHYITQMAVTVSTDESIKLKYTYPGVDIACFALFGVTLLTEGVWIMVFSILTFIHLWKRRHSEKLKVFCIFMATCIVCFIALLVVLAFANGFVFSCRQDWQHEWLLKSFSGMEHFVLLIVLMWLWRPSDTAQSYAFSPISVEDYDEGNEIEDDDGDDEEEVVVYHKEENGRRDIVELGTPK